MKRAIFLGLPCRLSGSWSTTQAGVKLDMRVVNRTIVVTVSNFTSSRLQESLLNETWNVSGHVPFKRGLPFTLIATHNYTNSIAVFVGMYLVSFANLYLYFSTRGNDSTIFHFLTIIYQMLRVAPKFFIEFFNFTIASLTTNAMKLSIFSFKVNSINYK